MSHDFQAHEIRDIIKINYKYSMGGHSKFFLELMNNKKILGAKCTNCGKCVGVCPRNIILQLPQLVKRNEKIS